MWNAGRDDALKKLMLYYIPFTIGLHTHLPELGTSLLLPPFATFAWNVIGYYLSQVLGSKTHNPRPSRQMLLCNEHCSTCASLQELLEQLYVPVQDFCPSRKTQEHFIDTIYELGDFISFTEVTGGRLRVVKHWDFLNSNRWESRLKQARDFLKSIGDDDFIEQLMGNRFKDLKVALEGKSRYNYTAYE
ncbi:hypothetical protein M378DRAFT_17345 [Amanita muscaria Koide BX008]|uniref:Uncharacterized protein n=1 Tax=Amanita muscaria (strain Koide BX008) TaxID=946122 RepID=A0A0C2S0H1_AMAMK|nr:hypothetical protein M378DRAFT_17345 [Amanita muscaria Koide BX008]